MPTSSSHNEIVRRILERGLRVAQKCEHSEFIDIFQHALDELERYDEATTTKDVQD